jgi:hypothetical protein
MSQNAPLPLILFHFCSRVKQTGGAFKPCYRNIYYLTHLMFHPWNKKIVRP